MENIKNARLEGKEKEPNIPADAEILKKDVSITVEEIENGYIIKKSYDISYMTGDEKHYEYYTKKWFAKDNPIEINEEVMQEKSLADKIGD